MNLEDAETELQSEREAYVAYFVQEKGQPVRRVQNRINKHVSRWKTHFYLQTAEDYHTLACEIKAMREGRERRREGKRQKPENRSMRRTSQRLADQRKRRDTETPEENSPFDSAIDFDFDQLDNAPPSEEDINISTESTTTNFFFTSSSDELVHSFPSEIDRAPDSNNLFDLCNSHTLSQYSSIPPLADENWCRSDDMNSPASISGMLGRWCESSQQDICEGSAMDYPASFNDLNDLSRIGEDWSGPNSFVPESHESVIMPAVHDPMKSASSGIDGGIEVQSLVASRSPEKVDNGVQQRKRLDQAQLYITMAELKSQLQERREDAIPERPVLDKRPLAERDDLAPLIEQCLTTLRQLTTHISRNK